VVPGKGDMDDILKRVLAVEREAEELVRKAEREAEQLAADARAESSRLEEQFQGELQEEVSKLIETRLGEAERRKLDAVEAAADETQAFVGRLLHGREDAVASAMARIALCDVRGRSSGVAAERG